MMPQNTGAGRAPKPRVPEARLYLDECGDHTYRKLERPGHRYFCLLGVVFLTQESSYRFSSALEELKRDIFGADPDDENPVILHRSEIVGRKGVFGCLRDPVLDERFRLRLLDIISTADFKVLACVMDKQRHLNQYHVPWHPYHYAMTMVLERFARMLEGMRKQGAVYAEARGSVENAQLQDEYTALLQKGSDFVAAPRFRSALTSKEIAFRTKKANIAPLQLADLLAHPVRCHVLAREDAARQSSFARELLTVVLSKFRGATIGRNDEIEVSSMGLVVR